jgi:hypothetical protein
MQTQMIRKGLAKRQWTLGPHQKREFHLLFHADMTGVVWVSGNGATDLNCFVQNAAGYVEVSSDGDNDDCRMEFDVRRTEIYTLLIENDGANANVLLVYANDDGPQ